MDSNLTAEEMFNLGVIAQEAGDLKGAKSWYERAAGLGNSKAMIALARIAHMAGDLKGTKSWLERAAELGNDNAMFKLGLIARDAGDLKGTKSWYERAAELGNSDAMVSLGWMAHEAGDLKGKKSWYERAAELGNVYAMFDLARIAHMAGDLKGAKSWYERAAELGDSRAMHGLGFMAHEAGDLKGAKSWWKRAAELGSANALASFTWFCLKNGEHQDAITLYKACRIKLSSGATPYELANVDSNYWLNALALGGSEKDAEKTWLLNGAKTNHTESLFFPILLAHRVKDIKKRDHLAKTLTNEQWIKIKKEMIEEQMTSKGWFKKWCQDAFEMIEELGNMTSNKEDTMNIAHIEIRCPKCGGVEWGISQIDEKSKICKKCVVVMIEETPQEVKPEVMSTRSTYFWLLGFLVVFGLFGLTVYWIITALIDLYYSESFDEFMDDPNLWEKLWIGSVMLVLFSWSISAWKDNWRG